MTRWKYIYHEADTLYDVGVNPDGSLHNPNGYPADTVRAAVVGAEHRYHERRSAAAQKAAETRRKRQDKRVYDLVRRYASGEKFGPRSHCIICKKGLGDPQSVQRGIGSDCWQSFLNAIQKAS